jgi:hypothetical protein
MSNQEEEANVDDEDMESDKVSNYYPGGTTSSMKDNIKQASQTIIKTTQSYSSGVSSRIGRKPSQTT